MDQQTIEQQYDEAMEKLLLVFEAIREIILEMARVIIEAIKRVLDACWRCCFYIKLVRWHLPHRIAKFIAMCWPRRWLPTIRMY